MMIDVQSNCFISSRYFDIELYRLVNITWDRRAIGKINCEWQSWFVTRILLYEILLNGLMSPLIPKIRKSQAQSQRRFCRETKL